jgi:hypothetical protein
MNRRVRGGLLRMVQLCEPPRTLRLFFLSESMRITIDKPINIPEQLQNPRLSDCAATNHSADSATGDLLNLSNTKYSF